MTTRFCQDKAVLVAVYAERPRLSRLAVRRHVSENDGYNRNRRAELLNYARNLRASARSNDDHAVSSPNKSLPSSHLTLTLNAKPKQFPPLQIVAADKKHSSASSPACCGSWDLFSVTPLLKASKGEGKKKRKNTSVSTSTKMKHLVESLRKNGSFLSKLLKAVQKHKNLMRKRFKVNK